MQYSRDPLRETSWPWTVTCGRAWYMVSSSLPDVVANSMSLLLALRISSFFSVSSSAREQMISPLWRNTYYEMFNPNHNNRAIKSGTHSNKNNLFWQPLFIHFLPIFSQFYYPYCRSLICYCSLLEKRCCLLITFLLSKLILHLYGGL